MPLRTGGAPWRVRAPAQSGPPRHAAHPGPGATVTKIKRAHEQTTAAVQQGWVEGGSFFGSIMAGAVLGWLGDRWLGTEPWLVVIGIIAGSISGFYRMWELMKNATSQGRRDAG